MNTNSFYCQFNFKIPHLVQSEVFLKNCLLQIFYLFWAKYRELLKTGYWLMDETFKIVFSDQKNVGLTEVDPFN